MMTRIASKTDAHIQKDVLKGLGWDTRVDQIDVGVEVDDGIVTLTRDGAEEPTDTEIAADVDIREAVEQALERQAEREAHRIRITVEDGTLTVLGVVRSWREKRAVLGTARHAPGVRAIVDRLVIAPYTVT